MGDFFLELIGELVGAVFESFVSEVICRAFYRPSQSKKLQPQNGIGLV
ncbi:hypothetical protein HDF10_002136 [Edaphobacter lichenicola]|uniref:Uncharacterized protein n=1 Tax=Tunturiibacter lichenicola TaxID=2051959 RepID=A0A7W8JA38_9BACT|nr:hypothetical protein [Edaphobacter lichenicola]